MKIYDLKPNDGRKSFYGKAVVQVENNGNEILFSYNTPIISRRPDGTLVKHWNGWSATTGRHIRAFCGLSKKEYEAL